MKQILLIFLCVLSLAALFSSGSNLSELAGGAKKSERVKNLLKENPVQTGDVVFRLGHGFISESMRKFSLKDPRYSHAGIISLENGKPLVYHLLGGETSVSVLKKEPLNKFCSEAVAASFAVYRASLTDVQKKSIDSLNRYYFRIQLPYDSRFELTTDAAMYCTEYVYKILSEVGGKNILISSSMLSERDYIACDDIYLNPAFRQIFSLDYE